MSIPSRILPRTRAARAAAPATACAVAALLAAVLCTATAGTLPSPATAAPLAGTDTGASPAALVAFAPDSLFDLQDEARRVRTEMKKLEADLVVIAQQWRAARERLADVSARLNATRAELARRQEELDAQRMVVAERARMMYKTGDVTILDVLLTSSSLTDAEASMVLLRRVADEDRRAQNELERLARSVQVLENDLEVQREEALAAQQDVDAEFTLMNQKLDERRVLLSDLTKRIKKILASRKLPATPRGGYTQLTWAQALLVALHYPVTRDNVAAIVAWEMAEGGHWYNTAYYNPLNTTWNMPGATSMNSVGVKAYTSWTQGMRATINTLKNGLYGGILAALRRGNDAQAVADAVAASPWGTGHFDPD